MYYYYTIVCDSNKIKTTYCIFIMNDTNNQFIDDDGLTKFTSLTQLLNDVNNTDTCDI